MNQSPKHGLTPSYRDGTHAGWVKRIGRGQPPRWICSASAAPTGEAADAWYEKHFAALAAPPAEPIADPADVPVSSLCDLYIHRATQRIDAATRGLSRRTVEEYAELLDLCCEHIGGIRHRDLTPDHFGKLHQVLSARFGLRRTSKAVVVLRSVFKMASKPPMRLALPDYGDQFPLPSKKDGRLYNKARRECDGVMAFTPAEIRAQLNGRPLTAKEAKIEADRRTVRRRGLSRDVPECIRGAGPALRAMILMGINAGMGNTDLAELPLTVIREATRDGGWLEYWRGKTGAHRLAWLWPETVNAIEDYLDARPRPADESVRHLCFLTPAGNAYVSWPKDHLALSYARLLKRLGQKRPVLNFYSLRRTYRSLAAEIGRERVIDLSMGHADDASDMGAVYTVLELREELVRIAQHVRQRVLGNPNPTAREHQNTERAF